MMDSRVRAPEFDGKDGSYARFMIKWQAFAQISGLVPSYTTVLPATQHEILDLTKADEKAKHDVLKVNAKGMYYLTLSLKSATVQNMAMQEMRCDPDWPVGLAHNVMAALEKKFKSQDDVAKMEMEAEVLNIKLTSRQNPQEIGESMLAV